MGRMCWIWQGMLVYVCFSRRKEYTCDVNILEDSTCSIFDWVYLLIGGFSAPTPKLCPWSQSTPDWCPSCGLSVWCRRPCHTSALRLTCVHGHEVVAISMAASKPELSAFVFDWVEVVADNPGVTGAIIARLGAHVAGGWRGRKWWWNLPTEKDRR